MALNKLQDIQERLEAAARTASSAKPKIDKQDHVEKSSFADFADVYSQIEEEPTKLGDIVRSIGTDMLHDTLSYARKKTESFDCSEEIQRELEVCTEPHFQLIALKFYMTSQKRCPPRVAKHFCIIRVKDYHESVTQSNRDCQLNVLEPNKLGEGFLREGRRYLVSFRTWCDYWKRLKVHRIF